MKAILCAKCIDFKALDPSGKWTSCLCGNVEARWRDPQAGTVFVRAKRRADARILGVNNRFLLKAIQGFTHGEMVSAGGQWEAWRELHNEATNAKGYIFDKNLRACWACVIQVGETGDVTWEPMDLRPGDERD